MGYADYIFSDKPNRFSASGKSAGRLLLKIAMAHEFDAHGPLLQWVDKGTDLRRHQIAQIQAITI